MKIGFLWAIASFENKRRRPALHPQGPGFSKKNASSSLLFAVNGIHPFGNQATDGGPSALGFAPRPYDRFALLEDEEAAGLICATFRLVENSTS